LLPRIHEVLVVALQFALCACSDPKEASKENFEAALNRDLAHDRECLEFKLPAEYYAAAKGKAVGLDQQWLEALARKGLVAKRTETKDDWRGIRSAQDIYELTSKGAEFVPKDKGKKSGLGSSYTELCYGVGKVVEVTNFTAPSNTFGQTVSQVQFAYKVHDVAEWASEPPLTEFKRLASAVRGEAITDEEMLLLTDNGWQTQAEFRRGRSSAAASAR
jgi:hypothetical protein